MSIRELNIEFMYETEENDFAKDFYNPCLKESDKYYRAAGYFSSSIFNEIKEGLEDFILRGGNIKIICSPNLSERDIEKIKMGYDKREVIQNHLVNLISSSDPDSFTDVSWLIKHKYLDIKIVLGIDEHSSLYHEKYGLFFEDEDYIVFWGSANETNNALTSNYESFTTEKSWVSPEKCIKFYNKFDKIWNNENKKLETYDFPEAARKELLKKYNPDGLKRAKQTSPEDDINIWKFQDDAVKQFILNNCKLIYEMATGTGKTRTALKTILELRKSNSNIIPIILVNQVDLMYQWGVNVKNVIGINPIYVGDGHSFENEIENLIVLRSFNDYELNIVIAVDKTYRNKFLKYISEMKEEDLFIIYDEAHNITPDILENLPKCYYRLGLTATLERKNKNEEQAIREYFGSSTYKFGIEEAIDIGVLTEYEYIIRYVEMTEKEYKDFSKYTRNIANYMNDKSLTIKERDEKIGIAANNRAIIIKKMKNKPNKLILDLSSKEKVDRTVIYCGMGETEDGESIISEISKLIEKKVDDTLKVSHYTSKQAAKRPAILEYFKNGFYNVLIAIKCLDEGVDIPMLQHLYILASDKSKKQTVQRRGRVMRNFIKKDKCYITDYIAIPPNDICDNFSKSLLNIELERVEEYNSIALNVDANKIIIDNIKKKYNIGEYDNE